MSSLTIESMDRMNFLITDVTLECLGNKFFDVYGTQVDSLFRLISSNTLKVKPTDVDQESDLCQSLTAVDAPKRIKVKNLHRQAIAAAAAAQAQAEAAAKLPKTKQPKRRASFSMVNNETDTANDPESLLMPMAPKAAKIANRRSTISVQLAKARTKKPIVIADDLEKVQIKTRKHTSDGAQSNVKPIADIRKTLIQNIDARKLLHGVFVVVQIKCNNSYRFIQFRFSL